MNSDGLKVMLIEDKISRIRTEKNLVPPDDKIKLPITFYSVYAVFCLVMFFVFK